MVILRSGSVTSSDISTMADMTSDQFALVLVEAFKLPDIQALIKNIVISDKELYVDLLSAEVHRQTQPLKEKDSEIEALKETIQMQQTKLDDLEQHGRLRVAPGGWYTREPGPWWYRRGCAGGLPAHEDGSPTRSEGHRCVSQSWETETGRAQTKLWWNLPHEMWESESFVPSQPWKM